MANSERRGALVTGAASGIGRAIAERLVADGLGVLSVDLEPGDDLPGEPHAADLTTRAGNRGAVQAALERFGRLDVVVPNAGFQHVAAVADFPEDRWDALTALLLTSPFLLAKYAWEALSRSGEGRFVVIASVHGLVASPYKAAYVSAKHGVIGLVKTLALEGADRGIAATAVCPAFVRTPLVEAQIADQAKAHDLPEERVLQEVIVAPHAVKRLIEPEEVAEVTSFLIGPGGARSPAPPSRWTSAGPLAEEAGHRAVGLRLLGGLGVTVNCVAPGFIDTEMVESVPEKVIESLKGQIPLGRLGEPSEVARVVHFLCADASAYITGAVWDVNGGMEM